MRNQVKIKNKGWFDLLCDTGGFKWDGIYVIGCDGTILDERVEDYIIFD